LDKNGLTLEPYVLSIEVMVNNLKELRALVVEFFRQEHYIIQLKNTNFGIGAYVGFIPKRISYKEKKSPREQ